MSYNKVGLQETFLFDDYTKNERKKKCAWNYLRYQSLNPLHLNIVHNLSVICQVCYI